MWTLIRNGGVVPMLTILLFGALTLGASFYFAIKPQRRSLGFIESMARATLFGTLAATAGAVGATLYAASQVWEQPDGGAVVAAHLIVQGLAESTSPLILGFSFLALAAMLSAVGRRRLDEAKS
ncbi:MAG: hypothetical protein JWP97_2638 [Labilithrix sp.]|nr:hypothetical protein [Labilithrix sp.]